MLAKDKEERISMQDTLDHPWFVGANSAISKMRKEAIDDGNEMLKFISYSNVDPNLVKEASKRSQGSGQNSPKANCYNPPSLQQRLNHGPGSGGNLHNQ